MFLGHFGLAMGSKRGTEGVSLGVLFFAAQWADLLWPVLVLADIERLTIEPGITTTTPLDFIYYPWSHSLLMGVVWGLVIGGLYYGWQRRFGDAVIVGVLVPSHWVLDFIVHRPDLPLWPGGPEVGLGVWNSIVGTLLVEVGLFAAGAALYLLSTSARDRIGGWGAYGLVVLLAVIFLGSTFGPVPENPTTVAYSALALWLAVPLAYWIDDHRDARRTPAKTRNTTSPRRS